MRGHDELAERFEERRGQLRAVAYRMLGSLGEADDAVQEAWLRLSRTGDDGIGNLTAWLTTVVSRVCLDMLRSRASRREDPYGTGIVVAPGGRLVLALRVRVEGGRVAGYEVVTGREGLRGVEVGVLGVVG